MHRILFFLLLFVMVIALPVYAAEDFIGTVKNVEGTVHINRQNEILPVEKGMKIHVNDVIVTGSDGAVGIILQDNTIFSMGPDSELKVKEFVFLPDKGHFSLIAEMIKGTFVYLSGVMGKLAPEAVKLETPVGTIAIRGTRFAAQITGN